MALLRTILAILIGFSLAVTPVGLAYASPAKTSTMTAMGHCDQKNMAQCPCCHKAMPCQFDGSCGLKCLKIVGCFPGETAATAVGKTLYTLSVAATLVKRSWPPPAPPPRS